MKWRVADFIVIAVVLICAVSIWLYPALSDTGSFARIEQGENMQNISLETDCEIKLENATAKVENGKISIVDADCPDLVCVKTGAISKEGQSIICVPNHIVITIEGENEIDAISN